ncbi:putative reverse transcriptase domain-containing protein [Tanacetum coccineum]
MLRNSLKLKEQLACYHSWKKWSVCSTLTRGQAIAIAQPWEDLKKLLVEEYCLGNVIKKLKEELWNHVTNGADVDRYTTQFHELARLVPRMVTSESKRIDRYIRGLASASRRTMETSRVRSFSIVAKEAQQDLNVMTSLKLEINKIVRGCGLELECHSFIIDSISFGHGSFDVNVGMDWLSKLGAKIVCFEKIVQIPLSNGKILEVHGGGPEGNLKQLKTMKVNEPKLEDIPVIRKFPGVFSEDLLGLPPSREVVFRIDLVPGITLSDDILIYSKSKEEHKVHPKLILELLEKEKLFGKFLKCEFWLQEVHFLKHVVNSEEKQSDSIRMQTTQKHEKNHTTHDLELGVVVFALTMWRHYLYGTKSVIYTDHKSLQHIFDHKELNMRQRWWIDLFSGDDCEICYHPGKVNVVADALRRKKWMKPRQARAMSMIIHSSIKARILEAQREASKGVNTLAEMLRGLDKKFERKEDNGLYFVE